MSRASEILFNSRKVSRPSSLDCIEKIFDDFLEFHGDRCFADDCAMVGGIASLDGMPVTVVGIQKGHTVAENVSRRFGSPNPDGYRKVIRLMKQAEKFHRPVVEFINTSGAYPGKGAEERGQGEAIARCLFESAGIKTPIISIFIGEGGSGGALAMAAGDRVWMLENGMYAVLSPEGFASILWRDPSRSSEAAELMKITATDLLANGVIEKIIPEAPEGIENNVEYTTDFIKKDLIEEFKVLCAKPIDELLKERYERFRKFGEFEE
ncbi:MAG: acetyl-CoA carboxylase carboxyl transferase subunit alpha [Clostridia bacterium]|jgi:acetyl-CoA carboxylase carboxyl transferase subunit alpha|nr:acetyl-CoA carboxylase carboxyl transferase subunit alpha [Clostridia bacterium]